MKIQSVICALAATTSLVGCGSLFESDHAAEGGQPLIKRDIAVARIEAAVETQPVNSGDDAADDAAIWHNTNDARLSRVLGTDKQQGLAVYNLQGEQLQFLRSGRLNNVDLRQQVLVAGESVSIAVASNRTQDSITVFTIDARGEVKQVGDQPLGLADPYGICMFKTVRGQANVLVNDKDGRYQQWQLDSLNPVAMTLVREFKLASQPEGCSVDEQTGQLFVGEENVGLWRMPADKSAATGLTSIDEVGAGALVADVEGVEVIRIDRDTAYVITSSQGDNTYAVYDAQGSYGYLGSFQVVAPEVASDDISAQHGIDLIDGTQETDGLTASAEDFGGVFSKGLLVIQDGYNRLPHERQNFKYVAWASIADALHLKTR